LILEHKDVIVGGIGNSSKEEKESDEGFGRVVDGVEDFDNYLSAADLLGKRNTM